MRIIGFLLLFIVLSCNKASVDKSGNNDLIPLEYTEKAILIEANNADVIVKIDESNQTYTLKKSAFENQPKTGEVIVVAGEIMRKVKSVSSSNDNYVVVTEDAALTEVIENGSFSWDMTPEWEDASSLRIGGVEVLSAQNNFAAGIEHTVSQGGVDHTIRIEPQMHNGSITACTFRFQMKKGGSTAFEAVGTATLPKQQTQIVIENGKLKKFNTNNKGLTADFKIQMATAGGNSGEHSLKLPAMVISIPIRVIPTPTGPIPNPIPMSINVGIQFVSQMTIPDKGSSATAKSTVSFDADAGFQYHGTEVVAEGKLSKGDITEGVFDAAANFGMPVDLQFGLAFPRVSLNIAGQEVAYVHVGYTTGSQLSWGPLCKQGYSKILISGGYELKVLGQSIISGTKDFVEKKKEAKSDGC